MTTTERPTTDATGATEEQLVAAGARFGLWAYTPDSIASQVAFWASRLIPPDHRLLGPEDIAALRRVTSVALRSGLIEPDDLDRLTALLGDEP